MIGFLFKLIFSLIGGLFGLAWWLVKTWFVCALALAFMIAFLILII